MIVGAAGESDYQIVSVAEALYRQFSEARVFYSAFVSVNEDKDLPVLPQGLPFLREHRLYQADWLLRVLWLPGRRAFVRKASEL